MCRKLNNYLENNISKKTNDIIYQTMSPGQIAQAMQMATDMAYALKDQRIAEAKLKCAQRKEKRAKQEAVDKAKDKR